MNKHVHRHCESAAPASVGHARDVVDLTYEQRDEESVIEQLGSGLAAWRMPVAEIDGNSAGSRSRLA
jgi:hypothetical protein